MKRFFWSPVLLLVFSLALSAQDQNLTIQRTRIAKQSVTIDGDRGLFTIPSVETLNKKQFSFGAALNNVDRTPRDLDVNTVPVFLSYGIVGRLTVTAAFEAQKQVTVRNLAQPGFNTSLPFAANRGNRFEKGPGDTVLSAKYRLNRKRDNIGGIALRGAVKFGTADPAKGLGTGSTDVSADIIFTSALPLGFLLQSNIGGTLTKDPKTPRPVTLKDELRSGFGLAWPSSKVVQVIAEYATLTYVGASSSNLATTKVQNPTDVSAGMRFLLLDQGLTFNAGYRQNTKFDKGFPGNKDYRGFVFSVSFTKPEAARLSGNHAPLIALDADATEIAAGGTVTLMATGYDADNDALTYVWTTTGGQITGTGEKATFRAGGAAPGKYTVRAMASDGHGGTATEQIEITVR